MDLLQASYLFRFYFSVFQLKNLKVLNIYNFPILMLWGFENIGTSGVVGFYAFNFFSERLHIFLLNYLPANSSNIS